MTDVKTIVRTIGVSLLMLVLPWPGGIRSIGAQDDDLWTSNGPDGGSISALAIDPEKPTTVYAGTGNGVFKSEDGGSSWDDASNGLTNRYVSNVAIDPRGPATLYAGTGGGLFKSADGGRNWSAVGSSLPSSNIRALAIDPLTPSTLYASAGGVIFKSIDGGASWSAASTGIRFPNVVVLAIDPLTSTTLYAGSHDGAFKSIDGGASWSVLSGLYAGGSYFPAIAIDPSTPTTLYASNFDGRTVYKSSDAGVTWSAVNTGLSSVRVFRLAIDPLTPSTLYAGTTGGVFKSTDGGGNWSAVNNGSSVSPPYVYSLAIDAQSPSTVYAGFGGPGVFKSVDGGGQWAAANKGVVNTRVFSLANDPQTPATLYAATDNGVHQSTDGGDTWRVVDATLYASKLAIDPQTPTTLYASGTGSRGVFKSTDSGATWRLIGLSGMSVGPLVIDPSSPNILYAGTTLSDGVFRSLDGGTTWTAVNTGLTARNVWALAIDPQNPTTLYAGTGYNYPDICRGVFKSTDSGSTWAELGPRDRSISSVAVDPQTAATLYASSSQWACGGGGPEDPGIYKSTDGGASWVAVNPRLTTTLAIDPQTPTTIYAGTGTSGIFRSIDGGTTWSDFSDGFTNLAVAALALSPTAAYAGTSGGGVFARATPHFTLAVNTSSPSVGVVTFGSGTVTSSPQGIDCGSDCSQPYMGGTTVTLTATPAPGSVLTGWDGCDAASDTTCAVTLNADRSVTAKFAGSANLLLSPQDTFLNLDATNYSADAILATYTWPDYQVANAIVMAFDLSALPAGAIVERADLYLALIESDASADATYTVSAHKLLAKNPIIAAATGYSADGTTAWTPNACCADGVPLAQADISPAYDAQAIDKAPGYKVWTLTRMVQEWLADPSSNFGLLLNSDASTPRDRYRFFASVENPDSTIRPALHIAYRLHSSSLVLAPEEDTFLNLDATSYSTHTELMTYTWPDRQVANAILMKFDLSGLPADAVVQEATLHLALTESDQQPDATYTVTAQKIVGRSPDIPKATGYTADGVTAWTANTCCYDNVPLAQADVSPPYDTRAIDKMRGYKIWTLTRMVQEWLADPSSNFGLLLNSDASKVRDRYRFFASREYADETMQPFLRVLYTVP